LPDAGTGDFTVYHQAFVCALREKHSRKQQDESKIKNESIRRVFAQHLDTTISGLELLLYIAALF
jgi:hypothetical protein